LDLQLWHRKARSSLSPGRALRFEPTLPDVRQAMQETRRRLEELVPEIQERVGPVDLEEGAEERLADLRTAMRRLVGGRPFSC
jgi:hypothetical protein